MLLSGGGKGVKMEITVGRVTGVIKRGGEREKTRDCGSSIFSVYLHNFLLIYLSAPPKKNLNLV